MSVSVMTDHATANAITMASTAPVITAMALPATIDHNFLHHGVGRWSGAGRCVMGTTLAPRELRRVRTKMADALAGLRQPDAISAMIANPAIQAEAVVSSVIDTQSDMVTAPDHHVRSPRPVHRFWAVPLVVIAFTVITLVLLFSMLPADLRAKNPSGEEAAYALVPANAEPVAPRISFDAVERFPAESEMLFVTVREPEITLLDWLAGRDQEEVRFTSYDEKFGTQTPEQQRQINVQLMRTAKETAEYVALNKLGFPVEIIPGDVIVGEIVCLEANSDGTACARSAPSDELLDPGDKLVEVDGVTLETLDDLSAILREKKPGDRIQIDLERPGDGPLSGEVELIASPDDPERTIIGFVPFDTASAQVPFEIDIDSGAIGGPSAGLAFTLTLIDELTPGELTGGVPVAVTGTIRLDGTVGAIGGLVQKASAAREMGAKVFIVPSEQSENDVARAREVAGDEMKIITVDDLDGALAALAELGGNGLELGQPGSDFVVPG
jgi:Lon-like protease